MATVVTSVPRKALHSATIAEEPRVFAVKGSGRIVGPVYATVHSANALRAFAVKIGL